MFLHNTAPGVVERLGLDGPTLRAADPRLVVVNISGYGTSGPRRDRKAYDMLIQAESGMVSVTGTPDTPTKTGVPSADLVEHPQLTERDRWRPVATEAGEIRGVLPPMTFRDVELPMGAVPALGEHTAAILAELGLDTTDQPPYVAVPLPGDHPPGPASHSWISCHGIYDTRVLRGRAAAVAPTDVDV